MNIRKFLHYEEEGKIVLQEEKTLRLMVGVLGIMLPFLLYLSVYFYSDYHRVMPSISHYYFTRGSFFLHLVVIAFSLILIIYKGYDPIDFWLSMIAGLAGLILVFFPTNNLADYLSSNPYDPELLARLKDVVTTEMKNNATKNIHLVSATVFFMVLAVMCIFLFTRIRPFNSKEKVYPTRGRIIQNAIYYICGSLIIVSLIVIVIGHATNIIDKEFYETNHLTFWLECVALIAFATSWLFKSNKLIKGKVRTAREYELETK